MGKKTTSDFVEYMVPRKQAVFFKDKAAFFYGFFYHH
jgi:hypothetical protein